MAILTIAALVFGNRAEAQAPGPCDPPVANPIACENSKAGNPNSEWEVSRAGDPSIQGFATDISVNQGGIVRFKINTDATNYRIDIYRLGYYGGLGARKITTIQPSAPLPQNQPLCLTEAASGLVDCGNWAVSASWAVPSDAVSGIYLARPVRDDNNGASHIVFIVRDDSGRSPLLFQTSDTTWQAYNDYGGNSLYVGNPAGRAYKVSYNRPFTTRAVKAESWLFSAEYPMVRFLEANGFHVSYSTGVDTDRRGAELLDHQVFLSVGHDEYWSAAQRANVEAARGAGIHLAFFSGNEVFWKTRWEPSIDDSNTAYRTLVSYKETHANAKIDPSSTWTGTWRDPRFSPPADGGWPENTLTGTLFLVNDGASGAIEVPDTFAGLRFWRNTRVAALGPGQTATFPYGTLGYEWDGDSDNGFRPPGLLPLTETTVDVSAQQLLDYGSTYGPGTVTHHLTLYRHSGGALVFGAGTVQWSWGLDSEHDGASATPDLAMQQATVNLFADMGVQPSTLQSGLVPAAASSDTTAPTSSITSPADGSTVRGTTVLITGTAADTGGGVVGAVEVSVDGGATWHRASGRASWNYLWTPTALGPATLMSRAVDDSGRIESPPVAVTVSVEPKACPCSLWNDAAVPEVASQNDSNPVEVGVKFRSDVDGYVTAVRFYKGSTNTGPHVANLWTQSGALLASASFTAESSSGWQQVDLPAPVPINANTTYVASYHTTVGRYAIDTPYFTSAVDNLPLHAPADGAEGGNGLFKYGASGFPNQSYNGSNYWVDIVFDRTATDTIAPAVINRSPATGATRVSPATTATATFSEPVTSIVFELRDPTNAVVPSSVTYDATTRTATLAPAAPLADSTTYTLTVSGATDQGGNSMPAPEQWAFTTTGPATSIWNGAPVPAQIDSGDGNAVELGVKFFSEVDGYITGLRFYKSVANVGTHVANLWTSTGTLLFSTPFTGESASGWQQVTFPAPVAITANTTYVASYHTTTGHYAINPGYFGNAEDNPPLHAPASNASGGNGVFKYGASGFPNQSYNASNYWVDIVFSRTFSDPIAPTVTGHSPATDATRVSATTTVTATFSEAVIAESIVFEVRDPNNVLVPSNLAYDSATRTATLTPSGLLAESTRYTATVDDATDLAGNPLGAPFVWSFTTPICPCSIWDDATTPLVAASEDLSAVELGLKFQSDIDGYVNGLRFYKGASNTGSHVANLWTGAGTLLATATFTGESASGWQQVIFPAPVAITANTTYVASYHTTVGRYAKDSGYFGGAIDNPPLRALADGASGGNGVFKYGASGFPAQSYNASNYWVDVVFNPIFSDSVAPIVTAHSPATDATRVPLGTTVAATFSEPVDPGSITFILRNGGDPIPGTLSYDAATRTATLTPSAAFALSTTYTATVSAAADAAGNPLDSPVTWSFSTPICPCTIWDGAATPAVIDAGDAAAVEVGVKFRSDFNGYITALRFYKSAANAGPHTANLWTTAGTLLTSVTSTAETSSGWQQVPLPTPVQITANATYVASYHTSVGHYSFNGGFFSGNTVVNTPLRALATGVDGANGVFAYGLTSQFPTQTFKAANYWIDVVFDTTVPPDTTPPTIAAVAPAAGASGVEREDSVLVTFSEGMDPATISASTMELRDSSDTLIDATVTYDVARRIATLDPQTALAASRAFTLTVKGGATDPRVKDLVGNALAASFTSSFTTGADTKPPTVAGVSPSAGASDIAVATDVTVTFSEDMDPSTITTSTIELRDASGNLILATVSYSATSRAATLNPTASLAYSATYTVTVKGGSATAGVKDMAGNSLASDFTSSFTTMPAPPSVVGQWEGPFAWPLVAVHAMLLRTGDVLLWDGPHETEGGPEGGGVSATIWAPSTRTFTPVPNNLTNLFCAGHASLPDGRILVMGGHVTGGVGLPDANIFDPVTRAWTPAPPMGFARWYPTATTLGDGRVLVVSGSNTCQACIVQVPEVYSPQTNTWSRLAGAAAPIPLYPYNFLLPDGRVLAVGAYDTPNFVTQVLDVSAQTWTVVDPVPSDSGSAAMYLPGKIIKSGTPRQIPAVPASANASVIDMNQPAPEWRSTAPMVFPRVYHTLTLLPDGTVLSTGGGRTSDTSNLGAAVLEAEVWSPATEAWTPLAPMRTPRLYHSTALLLPDGRVLVAGSGRTEGISQLNAEIYSPPYLFKGTRPVIDAAPETIQYGATFTINTQQQASIASVSLVRVGAVTHTFNYDQRFLNLPFRQTGTGLEVDAPGSANLAPPGYYMLFVVDGNGVPSVASMLSIASAATVRDAQAADFSAGTADANVRIAQIGPEVILQPTVMAEFTGTSLPSGWSATAWKSGGNATVSSSGLRVDGARVGTDALYGPGALEFVAWFQADAWQQVGLGLTLTETPHALFSTGTGTKLYARTHDGKTAKDTLIPGYWLTGPHRYRIEWTATSVLFWIDGVLAASHTVSIPGPMRPLVSDYTTGGIALTVNWLRMSPFVPSGTFLSRTFDAGTSATWGPIWWTSYAPPGTNLTISVRTGDTPTPGATWSPFNPISTSGTPVGSSSRYIQYRAQLDTTMPNKTPALWELSIGFSTP